MSSLQDRFDALQEQILNLYEKGSSLLQDQITFWDLIRKEGALEFFARKQGFTRLGLHVVPSQASAEAKAKGAISMSLYLTSLQESPYGSEKWTMTETSREMFEQTEPKNTFKKGGVHVQVYYDCDKKNEVSYVLWTSVYVQNEEGFWQKHSSEVDYYGVYFVTHTGEKSYYHNFEKDSVKYGKDKCWTVTFKNKTFTSCPDSSKDTGCTSPTPKRHRPSEYTPSPLRHSGFNEGWPPRTPSPSPSRHTISGRGKQGESATGRGGRRRHRRESTEQIGVSPEEVGRRSTITKGPGLGRYGRLIADARDPPIVLVKGPTNALKCWRNRLRRRFHKPFQNVSTAFSWVNDYRVAGTASNLLITFLDEHQRSVFLETVPLPKGAVAITGNLDGL
ncbi:E2 [Micromys minutus papillomavirus 1]|uniref:Regulatory protein E2 n=1 Tax=Micromys minutus papillomavirus TaxID=10568 RepID=A0EPK6_MMPV|nr:E2 [Micromys minutus papillomavirus 1]ABB85355.1 E2 [Micromys minutus papillomavirus 1]